MEDSPSRLGDAGLSEEHEWIEYVTNSRKGGVVLYNSEKEHAVKHNWERCELWERC